MLTAIADRDRADTYLETTGDGNIGFYSKKFNFEEKERSFITDPDFRDTFCEDGGMTFMVRHPRPVESQEALGQSLN